MNETRTNEQAVSETSLGTMTLPVELAVTAHTIADEHKARNGRVVNHGFYVDGAIVRVVLKAAVLARYECDDGLTIGVARLHSGTHSGSSTADWLEEVKDMLASVARKGLVVDMATVKAALAGLNEFWASETSKEEWA